MEMDGAILFTQDDAVFMMVETDGVVADAKQPFGQFFALRLWIDLSRRNEIDAVEPLIDARKSFEFKVFPNGFHPAVFAGGGVCEMHFGEIENGIFLDAEDGVQRNPFAAVGGQFCDLWFVERERGRHGEIDGEGFGVTVFPIFVVFAGGGDAQEEAFGPLAVVLQEKLRRLVETQDDRAEFRSNREF